ncbi:hypothetical protein [Caulobacter zeae]|nr:hypothetical protein [Caulobacter zeae]
MTAALDHGAVLDRLQHQQGHEDAASADGGPDVGDVRAGLPWCMFSGEIVMLRGSAKASFIGALLVSRG